MIKNKKVVREEQSSVKATNKSKKNEDETNQKRNTGFLKFLVNRRSKDRLYPNIQEKQKEIGQAERT